MLQRLGSHRPKLFAVMDCTSGYHQAPLSANSQVFTAFITFMGIFEWLRVPMGLKGAASYFQKVLSTIVLIGLLYYVCELYIDDIVVHAHYLIDTGGDFCEGITLRAQLTRRGNNARAPLIFTKFKRFC